LPGCSSGCRGSCSPAAAMTLTRKDMAKIQSPSAARPIPAAPPSTSSSCRTRSTSTSPSLPFATALQTLNVWRNGSLVQDLKTQVNHQPGRTVAHAHPARITPGSRLSRLVPSAEGPLPQVNSSHHQAVRIPGDNLLIAAVSPVDGVIEAVELDSAAHFVVGVQWHPERTYTQSAFSRAIFTAFAAAASAWEPRTIEHSVAQV
jgi:putative glutamine amidotransferase